MQELRFLGFAHHLMFIDIHVNFREDKLNGFQVIEWTFFMMDKVPREKIQKV